MKKIVARRGAAMAMNWIPYQISITWISFKHLIFAAWSLHCKQQTKAKRIAMLWFFWRKTGRRRPLSWTLELSPLFLSRDFVMPHPLSPISSGQWRCHGAASPDFTFSSPITSARLAMNQSLALMQLRIPAVWKSEEGVYMWLWGMKQAVAVTTDYFVEDREWDQETPQQDISIKTRPRPR